MELVRSQFDHFPGGTRPLKLDVLRAFFQFRAQHMPESVGTLVKKLEQLVFLPATSQERSMWSVIPSPEMAICQCNTIYNLTWHAGKCRLPEDLEQLWVEFLHVRLLKIGLGNPFFLCRYSGNLPLFLWIKEDVNFRGYSSGFSALLLD